VVDGIIISRVISSLSVFRWIPHQREEGSGYSYPHSVVLPPGGGVIVTEFDNHRVTCRRRVGDDTPVWQVGSYGRGEGQFISPRGLCLSGDSVWVADQSNHRVVEFGVMDGSWRGVVTVGELPLAVTAGPGRLYVIGGEYDKACVMTVVDGKVQDVHYLRYPADSNGERWPSYISYHDGLIAVTDVYTDTVHVYSVSDMRLVVSLGKDDGVIDPRGVGWDARDGSLVVVAGETGPVVVYGRDTWREVDRLQIEGAEWLRGICVREDGQMAVVDLRADRVYIYSPS
jgi:hypothetical protein